MNAGIPVHADYLAATGAFPSNIFLFDELSYTGITDIFEVLQHAHAVFGSVSFIQLLQSGAGVDSAGKAIFHFPLLEFIAVSDYTSDAAIRYILIAAPATRTNPFLPQMCVANTAIHAAGSDHC